MSDRGLDQRTAIAIDRLRKELGGHMGPHGPEVKVLFPVANTIRDIQHGLGQVPDGYVIVWADGLLHAEPGRLWTKSLAFMRATAANVHATLVFYTLKETRNEP